MSVKCSFRNHWVSKTYYHDEYRKFVCVRCGAIINHSPEILQEIKEKRKKLARFLRMREAEGRP
jgi:hypothetical protein